jgi:hypothetical protein
MRQQVSISEAAQNLYFLCQRTLKRRRGNTATATAAIAIVVGLIHRCGRCRRMVGAVRITFKACDAGRVHHSRGSIVPFWRRVASRALGCRVPHREPLPSEPDYPWHDVASLTPSRRAARRVLSLI